MESKLTLIVAIWVSGFIAGMILVARWLRIGDRALVSAAAEPVDDGPSVAPTSKIQRATRRLTGPVVAGARADVLRVRNATRDGRQRVGSIVGPTAR